MDILEQQFKQLTQDTVLSTDERTEMRDRLVQYMELRPDRAAQKSSVAVSPANTFDTFLRFVGAHHLPSALIVALLVSSAGVSAVAASALPGDLLYPIKVGVNEEVKSAFVFTPESEAAWNKERLSRRLEEAATLAVAGKLDGSRKEEVSRLLKEQTERTNESVREVEETDPVLALEVSSDVEDTFEVHEAILARAVMEQGTDVSEDARAFVGEVKAASLEASRLREEAETKIGATESPAVAAAAATGSDVVRPGIESPNVRVRIAYSTEEGARRALATARQELEKLNPEDELYRHAEAQIVSAEARVESGSKALGENEYNDAYLAFKDARSASQKVVQSLDAATRFNIEVFGIGGEGDDVVVTATGTEAVALAASDDTDNTVRLEDAKKQIATAQELLLTHQGYSEKTITRANEFIKNALAYQLRGEIALLVDETDEAHDLFGRSISLAGNAIIVLEAEQEENITSFVPQIQEIRGATEDTVTTPMPPVPPVIGGSDELPRLDVVGVEQQIQGTDHTLSGVFYTPTSCFSVIPSAVYTQGDGIVLNLAVEDQGGECMQGIKKQPFSVSVDAPAGAEVTSVTINGSPSKYEVAGIGEMTTAEEGALPVAETVSTE